MSRTKPWLANGISPFIAPLPFKPPEAVWTRIEATLGASFTHLDRNALSQIAGSYMALRQAELDPPSASDAFATLDAVDRAARDLQFAIGSLLEGDWATDRVRRIFDVSLVEIRADGD